MSVEPARAHRFGYARLSGLLQARGNVRYVVNNAFNFIDLDLGFVDSAPFLDAGAPPTCTPD